MKNRQGDYYYLVGVTEDLCEAREVYVWADKIVLHGGILTFIMRDIEAGDEIIRLSLAEGKWTTVGLADPSTGRLIGIERRRENTRVTLAEDIDYEEG